MTIASRRKAYAAARLARAVFLAAGILLESACRAQASNADIVAELTLAEPDAGRPVCDYDRLLLSPTGVAAVYRDPAPLLSGPSAGAMSPFGSRILFMSGENSRRVLHSRMALIEPAGWTRDGKLLIRAARQAWATTDGRTLVTMLENGPKLQPFDRIEPAGVVDTISRISRISPEAPEGALRSIRFFGLEAAPAAWMTAQEGRLTLTSAGLKLDDHDPLGITRLRAFVGNDGNARLSFIGDQAAPGIEQSLALIDHASGRRTGTFAPRHIEIEGSPLVRVLGKLPEDAAILDAATTGASGAALLETADGARHLLRWTGPDAAPSIHSLCSSFRPRGSVSVQLETVLLPAASASHAAPGGFLFRPGPERRCLILYYHGGPETSLKDYGYFATYRKLQAAGCDLLAVEYSGTVGGGLARTRQVARLGSRAFDLDAASVARWLGTRSYNQVAIVGVSYGGAPALAARKLLGETARLYLVAPLMSLEALRETDPDYRSNPLLDALHPGRTPSRSVYPLFEEAFYGGADGARRFDRDLRASYQALRGSDAVYLGKNDSKASPAALKALTQAPRVEVFPGVHEVVTGLARVWDGIAEDIAEDRADMTVRKVKGAQQ